MVLREPVENKQLTRAIILVKKATETSFPGRGGSSGDHRGGGSGGHRGGSGGRGFVQMPHLHQSIPPYPHTLYVALF